jgi:hypothetical protein
MTSPRRVLVETPQLTLNTLFDDLILPSAPKQKKTQIKTFIKDAAKKENLSDRLRTRYAVTLPQWPIPWTFPLMYRNGKTGLIETLSIDAVNDQQRTSKLLELRKLGELISNKRVDEDGSPLKVDLVHDCRSPDGVHALHEALQGFMRLIPKDNLSPLLSDLAHAQVQPRACLKNPGDSIQ